MLAFLLGAGFSLARRGNVSLSTLFFAVLTGLFAVVLLQFTVALVVRFYAGYRAGRL